MCCLGSSNTHLCPPVHLHFIWRIVIPVQRRCLSPRWSGLLALPRLPPNGRSSYISWGERLPCRDIPRRCEEGDSVPFLVSEIILYCSICSLHSSTFDHLVRIQISCFWHCVDRGHGWCLKIIEEDLKNILTGLARHLFGDVEIRWREDFFPFTGTKHTLVQWVSCHVPHKW